MEFSPDHAYIIARLRNTSSRPLSLDEPLQMLYSSLLLWVACAIQLFWIGGYPVQNIDAFVVSAGLDPIQPDRFALVLILVNSQIVPPYKW
jgi:hypothetical protein